MRTDVNGHSVEGHDLLVMGAYRYMGCKELHCTQFVATQRIANDEVYSAVSRTRDT